MSKSEEDDMTSGAINGSLLEVNALTYAVPESLCLFTARSFNRNFAQRSAYSGTQQETIRFDLNSSSLYCQPQNSYLTFRCRLITPAEPVAQASTGTGSMMNIFRSIVIRSKSGVEITRNDALNVFSRYDTLYNESPAYLQKYGALEGWCDVPSPTSTQVIVSSVWSRFAIPLKRFSKLFDTSQYLPAALMSGLSIELVLENTNKAFLEVGGSTPSLITGYEVDQVSIMLDNTTLTDASARVLNGESASNGLEILFDSVYTTIVDMPSLSSSINAQVRRACSEATQAMAIVVPQSTQANIKFDSFASVPWDTLLHRWRLGGLYMTSSDIQDGPVPDGVESFFLASTVSDVFKHPHMEGGISLAEFKAWAGVHAVSLEKNTSLQLSGSSTSNSRVLELDATFQTSVTAKQVYVMMRYATVVRCYLDNVAVTS